MDRDGCLRKIPGPAMALLAVLVVEVKMTIHLTEHLVKSGSRAAGSLQAPSLAACKTCGSGNGLPGVVCMAMDT